MFKKHEIFKVKSIEVDPSAMNPPTTAHDFNQRGMAYYARQSYLEAEQDLRESVRLDPRGYEGHYRLGMVLKALKRKDEAHKEFKKVVELLETITDLSPAKYRMLRRLALGHMNEIELGDWNLEKEIWQHIQ